MSKRSLSEADVCFQLIEPALERAGWPRHKITKEYAYTDGRIHVDGDRVIRGARKRVDYVMIKK
jgi:type I restriction enzyme, R subunit